MVTVKNRQNKVAQEPKVEGSKQKEGYAKLRQLSNLSVLPSVKPEAKRTSTNNLTIAASTTSKSAGASPSSSKFSSVKSQGASPKTVPRSSVQVATHPLKKKVSISPSKVSQSRPGPKSKTKLSANKPVNVRALSSTDELLEMKKNIRVNTDDEEIIETNDSVHRNTSVKSDDILIMDDDSVSGDIDNSDKEMLSEIMQQVEDLENSFKVDLETKTNELKHEKETVQQLSGKNKNLDLSLTKRIKDVEKLEQEKAILTKEIEDQKKKNEAFKSSNEGMMQKIINLNEDNTDINEKYKSLQLEMEEMKEKKDSEIKKEKESLKAVLQKHISNENTLKQTIKMFEKIVKEKGDDLQKEYEIVDQLKKKNEVLENSEKRSKLLLKKKDLEIESLKLQSKKNTDIFAKKLKQKQEDLDDHVQMYASIKNNVDTLETKLLEKDEQLKKESKKSSDLINEKQEELNAVNTMLEKVSKDLEKMEEWKVTEVEREKQSLISMIQKNLKESAVFKAKIDNLEKSVKDKDELIMLQNKKIELLDKKIVEKDRLFKDLKVKVSQLIIEYTQGLKEKDEQLSLKKQENVAAQSKIKMLENNVSKAVTEKKEAIKTISQFNRIIVDLSTKITEIKSHQKNEAIITAMTEKQLQNNVLELQKRDKKNSETVKRLQNEVSKWQRLEELRSKQNVDTSTKNATDDEEFQLMITYLWPIVSQESGKPRNVTIALPLLKTLDPVLVISVLIPPKPALMLTYLWPVVSVPKLLTPENLEIPLLRCLTPAMVISVLIPPKPVLMLTYLWPLVSVKNKEEKLPKCNKRKRMDEIIISASKRICLSYTGLQMKRMETSSEIKRISVPVVSFHQLERPLLHNSSKTLMLTYRPESVQDRSMQSPVDSSQGCKRKIEETGENTKKAKKLKFSQEVTEHEKELLKILQERIIRTMTKNLCNDPKVKEHVSKLFTAPQIKAAISVSARPSPLMKYLNPETIVQKISAQPLPMITYNWPVALAKTTPFPSKVKLNETLAQVETDLITTFPMIKCIKQQMTITVTLPPKALLMITYDWPIVPAKRTVVSALEVSIEKSTPSPEMFIETSIEDSAMSVPQILLMKSLSPEITVTVNYSQPPLLMITYDWPIVPAKITVVSSIETCIETTTEDSAMLIPQILLMKSLSPEVTVTVNYPQAPLLMITYNWPIVLAKITVVSSLEASTHSCETFIETSTEDSAMPVPLFLLMKSSSPEITVTVNYPPPPLLMITYNWPIVLSKKTLVTSVNESSTHNIDVMMPQFLLMKTLNQDIEITICYPLPPLLMITYNWPLVLAKPVLKAYIEIQDIASIIPHLPLARTLHQEVSIFINCPLKPLLMITYLYPLVLAKETQNDSTQDVSTSKKRKFVDQDYPSPKRICRVRSQYSNFVPFPLVKTVQIIRQNDTSDPVPTLLTNSKPALMLTYLWPICKYSYFNKKSAESIQVKVDDTNTKKRKCIDQILPSPKRICRIKSQYDIDMKFPLLKTVEMIQESEVLKLTSHLVNKSTPTLMLTYLWPVCKYPESTAVSEKKLNDCIDKSIDQILPSPERIFSLQSKYSLNIDFPLVMTIRKIQENKLCDPSSKLASDPVPTLMLTYLWPICKYQHKEPNTTDIHIEGPKNLDIDQFPIGKCLDRLITRLDFVLVSDEGKEDGLPSSVEDSPKTNATPMISYLWPLVPYNKLKVSSKRKLSFLGEENYTKRIKLSQVKDDERVGELSGTENNVLEPTISFVDSFSDYFPTLNQTSVKISNGEISTSKAEKKSLAMISYNWPIVVYKEPFNHCTKKEDQSCDETLTEKIRQVSQTQKNNSQNLQQLLDIQTFNTQKIDLIFAKQSLNKNRLLRMLQPNTKVISCDWPVSVYQGSKICELPKPQSKTKKRKLDQIDDEQLPKNPKNPKQIKLDLPKNLKRKLKFEEVSENSPKRIKEKSKYEKHHYQKIMENLVKMMTVKLCNDRKILEKTRIL